MRRGVLSEQSGKFVVTEADHDGVRGHGGESVSVSKLKLLRSFKVS